MYSTVSSKSSSTTEPLQSWQKTRLQCSHWQLERQKWHKKTTKANKSTTTAKMGQNDYNDAENDVKDDNCVLTDKHNVNDNHSFETASKCSKHWKKEGANYFSASMTFCLSAIKEVQRRSEPTRFGVINPALFTAAKKDGRQYTYKMIDKVL